MAKKQDNRVVWKKRGIIIAVLGAIVAIGELFSSSLEIAMLIIGFVVFVGGVALAGFDYLKYHDMLRAEKKKARAAEKQREQDQKEYEERQTQRQKEYEQWQAKRLERIETIKAEFNAELSVIPRCDITVGERVNRNRASDMPAIEFKNITKKTNISKLFPLVVVDIETTGLRVTEDIIEVAAIKFSESFKAESCISMLCKPRKPIPVEATNVNGITDDMVENCPGFSQIAASVSEYISGCTIVGHNLDFDIKRLFVGGVELSEKAKYYDTLKLARYVLDADNTKKYNYISGEYEEVDGDVENYKLDTLCEYYDIYRDDAHRALSDCLATAKLFKRLIEDKTSVEIG